ncbi:MAG TPA: Ni/Fe-hydrogenase cytochrome b subunit [Planctomycetota bacterium]|nr:Ni/Fe-hydrogenase cytochrome b subunit [Planctomycetota bacterium]
MRSDRQPLSFWRGIFYLLLATGLVLTVLRFTKGLGSVSNLSDRSPWGLWVGFDLLCGVGLAAGGFVVTGIVYIFHLERFRPIVRPTIMTAFLGYVLVTMGLLFDIGRPWNIWHPLVMWNPHSVMFEVAWCVTLYSSVLALETSGMVFEKLKWKRAAHVQHLITVPLVILGCVLSTLHQSSLGTLYLIVPGKLHALWYSPMLPILFWVSAVAIGFAMVIVESHLSARALGRHLEMPLLQDVARIVVGILSVYGVLRVYDLATRGVLPQLLAFDYEGTMCLVELVLGVALPVALLGIPRMRRNTHGLYAGALFAVLGFMVNRLNVSITGFDAAQGGRYLPSWAEAAISLTMVAIGFGTFYLAARFLDVFPPEEGAARREEHGEDRTEPVPLVESPSPVAPGHDGVVLRRRVRV